MNKISFTGLSSNEILQDLDIPEGLEVIKLTDVFTFYKRGEFLKKSLKLNLSKMRF